MSLLVAVLALAGWLATAAAQAPPAFVAVVLGAGGGPGQDDLSAYLLAPAGSADFVCLDAGTLLSGIRLAWARGGFGDLRPPADAALVPEGWILRTRVKAYLVSHAHLDHVAGLVVDSPEDASKEIIGLPATVDRIRDHLFNWKVWPNFGDDGEPPPGRSPAPDRGPGSDLTVVITHVKPALDGGATSRDRIAAEVAALNDLGLRLVLARQGQRLEL